jgi:hypothetical protein
MKNSAQIIFYIFLISCFLFPNIIFAAKTVGDAPEMLSQTVDRTGISEGDISTMVGTSISLILSIVGTAFFILMIYAGFIWMTARGQEDRVTKAKNTIITAVIGLVIVISAYAITNLVMNAASPSANGTPTVNGGSPGTVGTAPGGSENGCCIDLVCATCDDLTSPFEGRWIPIFTTQEECQSAGENADDPSDKAFGSSPEFWQFDPNKSWEECQTWADEQ